MGFAPVGAGLEEVVVKGIAYLEEDIGVYPLAAHDFVEVFAGVADLMRQPGDASSLSRKLRLDGLSDVKGFDRGFVVVHCSIPFGTFTLTLKQQKRRRIVPFVCLFATKVSANTCYTNKHGIIPARYGNLRCLFSCNLQFCRF
jgi:hypothetical protein